MYYKYSELYKQNSVDKQLKIEYDGGTITNSELYSEGFELTESLCSETNLKFGTCEASVLKFKIANVVESLKGKWLTVTETLAGNENIPFQFGKYKVYSDVPSADRNYRDVTAYDSMYDILNADMTEWYNGMSGSSVSIQYLRTKFLDYFGVEYEDIVLPNDYMIVQISTAESLSGKDFINAICELNGCFGHFGRDGKFYFKFLTPFDGGTYPGNELYPSDSTYPDGGAIAELQSRFFDGNYKIEDGYLYFKVYGKFGTKDISGNEVWYDGNYEARFRFTAGCSRACIRWKSGFYVTHDDEKYYSPNFYWLDSSGVKQSDYDIYPEIDLNQDGTFSYQRTVYILESQFNRIAGVPVFEADATLYAYLSNEDISGCINWNGVNDIEGSQCISGKYEDYTVKKIDCIQIRNEENDIGAVAGEGENLYVIEDNFLCYGKTAADLQTIVDNIYNTIKDVSYLPYEAEVLGNPCLEVADRVRVRARNKIIESYILKRTIKGIQSIRDTYSATGEEVQSKNVNSVGKSIIQLKKRTNTLKRTVDETISEIYSLDESGEKVSRIQQNTDAIALEVVRATDKESELSSMIEQTAEAISLKVNKGEVSSEISVESGGVSIKGNRLTVESDNFKLDGSGMVEATGSIKTSEGAGVAKLDSGSLSFEIGENYIGEIATAEVDSETLGMIMNTSQKFLGIGIGDAESATGYYYLNNGLNPNGVTYRHYFEGNAYFSSRVRCERVYFDELNGYIYAAGMTDADARMRAVGNFSVKGDLSCDGTKNRIVNTKNYGNVLMNAMESTGAYFTDIGSGKVVDGVCYVYLDAKFMEVIDTMHEYQVFITSTSKEKTEYIEKYNEYFIVYGEDGATFDWMLTAKQKDYQNIRMETISDDEKEPIDYDESVFYEDNIASTQTEEYMSEFADNIDNEAIAYVTNLAEMENEQFLL